MNEVILDIFPPIHFNCSSFTDMCTFIKNRPNVQYKYFGTGYKRMCTGFEPYTSAHAFFVIQFSAYKLLFIKTCLLALTGVLFFSIYIKIHTDLPWLIVNLLNSEK